MIAFVDLHRQYLSIKKGIDSAISRVINSGWFILGNELDSFEKEFATYCGVKYAIGVGSGTEAIHLALLACGIKPGDGVITVPNTATPTVSAISFANARPFFIDIDPHSYTIDPNRLEDFFKKNYDRRNPRIYKKIKAILPVHLFGHPAEIESLLELAAKYELKIIEDACQSHGAEYKRRKVGSFGDAGCFSFYPTKNLGAYGDAGMVITNSKDIDNKLRMLRNYGEAQKYYNVTRGYNSRLDEIQAAVLRTKLEYLDLWNEKRRNHAKLYNRLLKKAGVILPVEKRYAKHVYHLYVIRAKKRNELQDHLKNKKIVTSIHYPIPIHWQPAYRDLGYERGDFPAAEKCASEILSLPMYPELKKDQIKFISQEIKIFYEKNYGKA